MTRRVWLSLLLIGTALLAGCASGPNANDGETDPGPSLGEVPEECDADRPAVSHRNGMPAPEEALPIVPCLSKTGWISREPTMGISAAGTVFHYPAMTGDNTQPMGVAVSRDRAASWEISMPNVAGQPTHRTSVDPYFYHDVWTDRIFADDLLTPNCSYFSWSDDEGATWTTSYSGCLETDHQTIFSGPPVQSEPIGYPNVVYRCAMNAVALGAYSTMATCQKSIDGGMAWLPPGDPAFSSPYPETCSGAHGHGVAGADGTIYLPKGHCGVPMLAISDDEGDSWRRVAVAEEGGIAGHESGVGVDREGTIYYTWVSAEDRLPYVAYSRDEGATWSEPIMFGPPDLVGAVFPMVYVGGVGRLAMAYMGTTGEDANGTQTYDGYLTVTYDALSADPVFHSVVVHDPVEDAFIVGGCCGGLQDFMDVIIGPDGTPWGAYVDDCIGEGTDCEVDPNEVLDVSRVGAVGWMHGAPSLWDDEDPNGPYP